MKKILKRDSGRVECCLQFPNEFAIQHNIHLTEENITFILPRNKARIQAVHRRHLHLDAGTQPGPGCSFAGFIAVMGGDINH